MPKPEAELTANQKLFRDIVLGTLVYSIVFGFFNDYTSVLYTSSYSTTFAGAFVMQLLTHSTLGLKSRVVRWFKRRTGLKYKFAMVFCVWLIMFLSKFVFLEVINIVFRDKVEISGFIGLMVMIVCMMVLQKIVELAYQKLGNKAVA